VIRLFQGHCIYCEVWTEFLCICYLNSYYPGFLSAISLSWCVLDEQSAGGSNWNCVCLVVASCLLFCKISSGFYWRVVIVTLLLLQTVQGGKQRRTIVHTLWMWGSDRLQNCVWSAAWRTWRLTECDGLCVLCVKRERSKYWPLKTWNSSAWCFKLLFLPHR
jgi:hypothetical protein